MIDFKNYKQIGEIGERIAIGELAKYGIDVLLPMSDNLPFDFVIYYNDKFFKCQVKTTHNRNENDSLMFSLTSNNWNKKTKYIYNSKDYDILILCDMSNVYLFRFNEISNKRYITLRDKEPKKKQGNRINFAEDYIISEERLKQVLI